MLYYVCLIGIHTSATVCTTLYSNWAQSFVLLFIYINNVLYTLNFWRYIPEASESCAFSLYAHDDDDLR